MGRTVKRVALNFAWPLNKVWDGYVNPHGKSCAECDGTGETTARQRLSDLVSLLMLSGDDARQQRCHPYFHQAPLYYSQGVVPSQDMAELTKALAGRPTGPLGHDSVDKYEAVRKILKAAKLPKTWGLCPACDGHGDDPESRAAAEAWEPTEPPAGPGWQMWETVSEGSPVSPVFTNPEDLARWMAQNGRGMHRASYSEWLAMITSDGWAPTGVIVDGEIVSPVAAVAKSPARALPGPSHAKSRLLPPPDPKE